MLVLAEGLFRLDIVLSDDTIKTVVRNLSSGAPCTTAQAIIRHAPEAPHADTT